MQIMGFGIDYSTGELLVRPIERETFAEKIVEALSGNIKSFKSLTGASDRSLTFRGEKHHTPVDLCNPKEAGWTYMINEKDPQRDEIIKAIRPLAEYRGMKDPESPLIFNGEAEERWEEWMQDNLQSPDKSDRPYYITIYGGPDMVPFRLQSLLDTAAAVGRLDFESVDELSTYVNKIIHLEKAADPVTDPKALIFAPDGGASDPTYYSRHYMAEPLADHITNDIKIETATTMGDAATKNNLKNMLMNSKAALVYTASHGLGATDQSLDFQKEVNGAICCQHKRGDPWQDWAFTGDDVPFDRPFLEGSIFFQFACFGYGTPAESDYSHWLGNTELNCSQDFVAALPKRLLSHPNGPIAFVGHVDTAWLSGFDDPNNPNPGGKWSNRISPFVTAVNRLLDCETVGLAMDEMNQRYGRGNAQLATFFDLVERKKATVEKYAEWLADTYIYRSDAQNYMIYGDPAVKLRIPSD